MPGRGVFICHVIARWRWMLYAFSKFSLLLFVRGNLHFGTMSDVYEVEKIVGSRKRFGQQQYLVHWAGFDDSEDSWESEKNLQDCREKLNSYFFHVNSADSRNSQKRNEFVNERLSVTPQRKFQSMDENGVNSDADMSVQKNTYRKHQMITLAGSIQTEISPDIGVSYDALNPKKEKTQKLDDSLEREIDRITLAHSKKRNSFSEEYYLLQCLKEIAPLFVFFFCSILIVTFMVPFLQAYYK